MATQKLTTISVTVTPLTRASRMWMVGGGCAGDCGDGGSGGGDSNCGANCAGSS